MPGKHTKPPGRRPDRPGGLVSCLGPALALRLAQTLGLVLDVNRDLGKRLRVRGDVRGGFLGMEMVHPAVKVVEGDAPLPQALTGQAWLLKLHAKETGIPYGIALAIGALMIYPHTEWVRAIDLARLALA